MIAVYIITMMEDNGGYHILLYADDNALLAESEELSRIVSLPDYMYRRILKGNATRDFFF